MTGIKDDDIYKYAPARLTYAESIRSANVQYLTYGSVAGSR